MFGDFIHNNFPFWLGDSTIWRVRTNTLFFMPTIIVVLLSLVWIIFLFPEWKKNIVLVPFILLAVLIFVGGVFSLSLSFQISRKVDWMVDSGIVTSSFVETNSRLVGTIDNRNLSGSKTVNTYVPVVVCKYTILGKEYSNKMVAGDAYNNSKDALNASHQCPVGKKIDFYYDPKNPDNSVIEIPSTFSRMLPLIMGLIFIPGGLFIGWILMINLYNNGKSVDAGDIFRVPVRLEYKINKAVVKIFKIPETETQKLESYMEYLGSIKDYIDERGNYSRFYTQERVLSEQINTMERLIAIAQNDPKKVLDYGEKLFGILDRADRLGDAKVVLEKMRDKYPLQFNTSYLKDKLALDTVDRK